MKKETVIGKFVRKVKWHWHDTWNQAQVRKMELEHKYRK